MQPTRPAPRVFVLAGALVLMAGTGIIAAGPAQALSEAHRGADARTGHVPPEPPLTSQPNQGLIAFLRSPVGVVASGALVLGAGYASGAAFLSFLRPSLQPTRRRRSRGRGRQRPDPATPHPPPPSIHQAVLAAAVSAGCLLLPVVFTIALGDVYSLPKTVVLLLLAVLAGSVMGAAIARGARPVSLGIVDLALGVFLVLSLAATIMSVDPDHSVLGERYQFQGLLSMVAYVVLFIGARFAITEASHVRVLSVALLISGFLAAVYAVVQWVGLDPIWSELYKGRVFSTMGQANALAAFLATAIVMALALVGGRGRRSRAALAVALAVIGAGFVLTFGRGGYLALAVAVAGAGLVLLPTVPWGSLRQHMPRVALAFLAAGVLLFGLTLAWQPARELVPRIAARVASIADPAESSNRIRLDLWTVGLAIAADEPLVGTGPDSYVLVFPGYRDEVLPAERAATLAQFRPESPHNVYIAIAAGQGIPALAAYVTIIAASLVLAVRAARSVIPAATRFALAALVGAVLVHLVTDFFMTGEPATTGIGWVVLGSLAGLSNRILSRASGGAPASPA